MLTHETYYNTLRSLNSATAEWRSILAGLLVLRTVDAWLGDDATLVTGDGPGLQAVHEALAWIRELDPVRPVLCDLVAIMTQSASASIESLVSLLFSYGQILYQINQWHLALDVFASVLSHAQVEEAHLTAARAASRVGFVLRNMGHLQASSQAYNLAMQKARLINHSELYFKACCGAALTLVNDGQITEAKRIFDKVLQESTKDGLLASKALVLHNLSSLAFLQEDYPNAIRLGQEALLYMSSPAARNRVISNIGGAFIGCNDHRAAKNLLVPLLSVQNEVDCQRILVNFLEIAAKERDRPAFDRYRRELDGTIMIPELQTFYHLFVAKGHYYFDDVPAARESWHTALSISETHGLWQVNQIARREITAFTGNSP